LGEEEVGEEGEARGSTEGLCASKGGGVFEFVEKQAEVLVGCVGVDEDGEDL